jgi:hypothetical protein
MIEYNSFLGTNDMILSLFNREKLENMKLFTRDLKKKISRRATSIDPHVNDIIKTTRNITDNSKHNPSLKSNRYLIKEIYLMNN